MSGLPRSVAAMPLNRCSDILPVTTIQSGAAQASLHSGAVLSARIPGSGDRVCSLGIRAQWPGSTSCGYSGERFWNDRIFGFRITPSRISIARRIVSSASQPSGPAITMGR